MILKYHIEVFYFCNYIFFHINKICERFVKNPLSLASEIDLPTLDIIKCHLMVFITIARQTVIHADSKVCYKCAAAATLSCKFKPQSLQGFYESVL